MLYKVKENNSGQEASKEWLDVCLAILQSVVNDVDSTMGQDPLKTQSHEKIKPLISCIEEILDVLINWGFSPTEYKIFKHFMTNPWEIQSRDHLLNVLDSYDITDRTIDAHVWRLRKRLEQRKEWLSQKIETVYWWWYYGKIGDFDINFFQEKSPLNNEIFFIPQLKALYRTWEKNPIILTEIEEKVFSKLFYKPSQIFLRNQLMEIIWYEWLSNERNIDFTIGKVRKKLNSIQAWLGERIKTHRWVWYSWE